jgi:peptide/nickel transport system permease protein
MALVRVWRTSLTFRVGFVITLFLVLGAIFSKVLLRLYLGDVDPLQVGLNPIFLDPNGENWLGTDRFGRDVLGLVLVGLPNSVQVAVLAGGVSTALGALVGFFAGYKGGLVDSALRTVTDMLLVIPTFPLIIILAAYARSLSIVELSLVIAAFEWPFAARIIRSQVLSLRERPYIDLSRITNLSDRQIIFQDILPNMLPYLGIGFAVSSVGAAFALAGLTIIGLGPSGTLDLGAILYLAEQWGALSLGKWPILAAPVVLLVLIFLGVALINQGLEEFYNPRLRGERR